MNIICSDYFDDDSFFEIDNKIRDLFQACATWAAAGDVKGHAYSFGFPRPDHSGFLVKLKTIYRHFADGKGKSGIYNLGTGNARSFYDLAMNTMKFAGKNPNINYIDMPIDIRDKYQYFTEASMQKIKDAGYKDEFYSFEDGIKDYVQNYLMNEDRYL